MCHSHHVLKTQRQASQRRMAQILGGKNGAGPSHFIQDWTSAYDLHHLG